MFDQLTDRLGQVFKRMTGSAGLTEGHVDEALKEIRRSLLEADVHFKVVKDICEEVKAQAIGQEVLKSLNPGQQVVKIFHEKLVEVMTGQKSVGGSLGMSGGLAGGLPPVLGPEAGPQFAGPPPVVVLVAGLQGSGKTTFCAKLGLYIKKKLRKSVGIVPADCARPAAKNQLMVMGGKADVPVFDSPIERGAQEVVNRALQWARSEFFDVLIVDTAGRQQVDAELMTELQSLNALASPMEKILVVDSMIGSQGLEVAKTFHEAISLTGMVLSKLDGDARGGVALSARYVTGLPIYFASLGEKVEDLEVFHGDRMASRVLGMGDVLTLIEKAQENISEEKAMESMEKMSKGQFTLEDFRDQMKAMQAMGPLEGLLKMIPGMGQALKQLPQGVDPQKEMKRVESIINSMTKEERRDHTIINGSRRLRIAKGSGTSVPEINRFIKQFMETQKMMRQLSKMGLGGALGKGLKGGLGNLMKGLK